MMENRLEFRVRSGGSVVIALDQCRQCVRKVCVEVCRIQGGPLELDERRGWPVLRLPAAEVERGGCVECLGCELDCGLYGRGAITIHLPIERLDEYLSSLPSPAVYQER